MKIIEQIKDLGTLVSNEEELQNVGFSEGKKVFSIIKDRCPYCHTLMDSWTENKIELKNYLSKNGINLLFIERNQSLDFALEKGNGSYPLVRAYRTGKQIGGQFTLLYVNHFIEWLKEIYQD